MKIATVKPGPHCARRVERSLADPAVAAVVLVVDSPGGRLEGLPRRVHLPGCAYHRGGRCDRIPFETGLGAPPAVRVRL
jgi:hypothetical protein